MNAAAPVDPKKLTPRQRSARRRLIFLGPVVLAAVAGALYLFGGRTVSTDNAYVKSDKVSISPQISGQVVEVLVHDNQEVKAGDVLFRIDPRPFAIALAQAKANLDNVRTNVVALRADYRAAVNQLSRAQDALSFQTRELARANKLVKVKAISQAQFDQAQHNYNDAHDARDAAKDAVASAAAKIGGDPSVPVERTPQYQQAKAQFDKAQLDYSHVNVPAPRDGVIANMSLRAGDFAAIGLPSFSLLDSKHLWIEANFKETDLTHVRVGQPVSIEVDTYGGRKWHGKVASLTPATGNEFSLLPAENSSGNWVKVVQRLMVKVEFTDYDGTPPLASGMSTSVDIDTGASRFQRLFGKQ